MAIAGCLVSINAYTQVTTTKTKTKTVSQTVANTSANPMGGFAASSGKAGATIDLGALKSGAMPFDVDLHITDTGGAVAKTTALSVDCWYGEANGLGFRTLAADPGILGNHTTWYKESGPFQMTISPGLKPNRNYTFFFRARESMSAPQLNALTKVISPLIDDAIKTASKKKTYELSDPVVKAIVAHIESRAADSMLTQGINMSAEGLNPMRLKVMSNSLLAVSNAFETMRVQQKNMDDEGINLKKARNRLNDFELKYAHLPTTAANDADILLMKKLFSLFPQIERYPDEVLAMDATKNKAYLDSAKKLSDNIAPILPHNPTMDSIRKDVQDYVSGIRDQKFQPYADAVKKASDTETIQAAVFAKALSDQLYEQFYTNGSTVTADFVTRSNLYICMDLGLSLIPEIGQVAPYFGTNIYLRPINKSYNLSFSKWDLEKRVSVMFGLTAVSLSKTGYRADLLGTNFNLLTGVGFRVADFVRLNTGVVWYGQVNPNPLNTNKSVAGSWFVSFAFDISIKTVLNSLFDPAKVNGF